MVDKARAVVFEKPNAPLSVQEFDIPVDLFGELYLEAAKKFTWPKNLCADEAPPLYPERKKLY